MKKKVCAALIVLMLLTTLCAEAEPMLYMVTDTVSGATLYLLPTVHMGDEETEKALEGLILDTLDGADRLAAETDVYQASCDFKALLGQTLNMRYADGTTAADHLTKETYEQARALFKRAGVYSLALEGVCVPVWYAKCEEAVAKTCGFSAEKGIDMLLLSRAHENNMAIDGLETADEQYALLLSMSDALSEYYIAQIAENPDAAAQTMYQSIRAWLDGDADALYALNKPDVTALPQAIREEGKVYWQAMLADRNARFFERAKEYLKSGEDVFMMVGAMHILGDDGLAARLERAGYTVDQVQ